MAGSYEGIEERELILLVQKGETEAFQPLVVSYKDKVFNLLLRSVHDFQAAEELAQDVFVKAYSGIGSFRFESTFSTWLTRIALNTLSTFLTSKYAKQRHVTDSFDDSLPSQDGSPDEALMFRQRYAAFHRCYQRLSERLQRALLLVGLHALSYEESAEILEIPIGTVRSRLNQARLLVLQCMTKSLGEAL